MLIRLAAAWLLLALGCATASAHASLVRSDPADGAALAAAPERFVLTFNEPVSPLVLRLIVDGAPTPLTDVAGDGTTVTIGAPPGLGDGGYALSWRVVSTDGHPIGGSIVFSIGDAEVAPRAIADEAGPALRAAIVAARVLVYLGLFVGIGGLFFAAFVAVPAPGAIRGMAAALAATPLALFASVGLQGLDALDLPLSRFASTEPWETGAATTYGMSALVAVLAVVLALIGLGSRGPLRRGLALLSLVALGAAFAITGHASAAPPQWVTRPAVFIHTVGVAVWAGALLPLGALLLGRSTASLPATLARFSSVIPWAVLPLVVAGVVLAIVQIGTPAALVDTGYGLVLLAKGALLVPLFALAVANRVRLTRPVRAGDEVATRRLAASVAAEMALVAAILGVVALWRFTPPPRSFLAAVAPPALVHVHGEKGMAMLSIIPGRAGPVTVTATLAEPDGTPMAPKEVTLTLSQPEAGIEPIRRAMKPVDGAWTATAITLPAAGTWTVRAAALVTDFDLVTFEGQATLPP